MEPEGSPVRTVRVIKGPTGAQDQRKLNFVPKDPELLNTRTLLTTNANGIMRNARGKPFLPRAPNPPPAGTFQGWNSRKAKKSRKSKKSKKARRTRKN